MAASIEFAYCSTVPSHLLLGISKGLREVLEIFDLSSSIEIKINRFEPDHKPYYLKRAVTQAYRYVHVAWPENVRDSSFDVVVLNDELKGFATKKYFWACGVRVSSYCLFMSTARLEKFLPASTDLQVEIAKTMTMHEIGHVLGAPSIHRSGNVNNSGGQHCSNRCVMRSPDLVPPEILTADRISHAAFCDECWKDIMRIDH